MNNRPAIFLLTINAILLLGILAVALMIFNSVRKPWISLADVNLSQYDPSMTPAVAVVQPVKIGGVVEIDGKVQLEEPVRVSLNSLDTIRVRPDDLDGMPVRVEGIDKRLETPVVRVRVEE